MFVYISNLILVSSVFTSDSPLFSLTWLYERYICSQHEGRFLSSIWVKNKTYRLRKRLQTDGGDERIAGADKQNLL